MLLDLTDASAGRLAFGVGRTGRFALEDGLGVRWADVHPGPRQRVTLALPAARWARRSLFLQSMAAGNEYRFAAGQDLELASLAPSPLSLLRRGAVHEAFAHLFAAAFDLTALTAPPDAANDPGAEPRVLVGGPDAPHRTHRRALAAAVAAAGVAGIGIGAALFWSAADLRDSNLNVPGERRPAINDQIDRRKLWGGISLATGAVLSGLAAILLLSSRQ